MNRLSSAGAALPIAADAAARTNPGLFLSRWLEMFMLDSQVQNAFLSAVSWSEAWEPVS